jgi:hypothetical protein
MYARLFELPPSEAGLVTLGPDQDQVVIPVKHAATIFITVMPFDSYGQSVGRVLYPVSNELKFVIP